MKYYLYNPLANNGIRTEVPGAEMIDASGLDYAKFFGELKPEDEVSVNRNPLPLSNVMV